jgi:hypothetical protein
MVLRFGAARARIQNNQANSTGAQRPLRDNGNDQNRVADSSAVAGRNVSSQRAR